MKQVRVAAMVLLLLMSPLSFASVVVGDDQPVFALGIGSIFSGQSVAQSFTLTSDTTVNQVDLSFLTLLTHSLSGAYPFTIHITNGLAAGSQELLTLNESIPLPLGPPDGQRTFSYGFPPITLAAGTYYLILTSSFSLPSLEWEQNQIGSGVVGSLGPAYLDNGPELGLGWQVFPPDCPQNTTGLCTTNGTMAFDLDFVRDTVPIPPVGGALGQGVRLTVVAGPANVPPGAPVEANLGFVDVSGNPIGPSAQVSLSPGQTQSLEFNADTLVQHLGRRVEVRPVVTPLSTDPSSPSLHASVEVFDLLTGFGTLLAPAPAVESLSALPSFVPQGLAAGQTMRLNVVAFPPDPCIGQLSFADKNGAPVGSSMPVNLNPGMVTSLDLNADTLGLKLGQHIEVQPVVSAAPSASVPIASTCQGSVEVFDHLTGRTWTYQTQLPAVQLPAVQ
jgi:hypothetical protein